MTNWKKKQFDKKHARNYYAKELYENSGKYRPRVKQPVRLGDEKFSKAKVLREEFNEED